MTDAPPILRQPVSRRIAIGAAAVGLAGAAMVGLRSRGGAQPAAKPGRVDVRSFGARGDGRADDTQAFQAAHDALPGGGAIIVGAGTYRVSRVDVRNRGITVELAADAAIVKAGSAGVEARGIFVVANLIDAHFTLRGGRVDLNGEGPMGIGQPGRLRNTYAPLTIPSVTAISGPANAAVYALRSSHVTVSDVTIENSAEDGVLIRNCSDTLVERCRFRNLGGYGVEWSMVGGAADGGSGTMTDRSRNHVRGCSFEDLDDYGLGSGNGAGVGGGGTGAGWFHDYSITDCTFQRCQADINFEFVPSSGVDGLEIARCRSRDNRQAGFGLVGVRNAVVRDYVIENPGAAPTAVLGPGWPSSHGGSLSTDFRDVRLIGVQVIDRRAGSRSGTGGSIARGSRIFSAADARFTPADAGSFIGIRGANPQGVCYVGRIQRVIGPTQVELDLAAQTAVRGAQFAYGGACREGLRLFHGTSATLEGCRIEAGTASGLPGEPPAAGIRIESVRDPVAIDDTSVTAPRPGAPIGIDVIRARLSGTPRVGGFARALVSRQ